MNSALVIGVSVVLFRVVATRLALFVHRPVRALRKQRASRRAGRHSGFSLTDRSVQSSRRTNRGQPLCDTSGGGGYLPSPVAVIAQLNGRIYQMVLSGPNVLRPPGADSSSHPHVLECALMVREAGGVRQLCREA